MTAHEEQLVGKMLDKLIRQIRKFEESIHDPKWGKTNAETLIENGVKDGLLEELVKMKKSIKVETPGEQKLLGRIVSLEERVKGWRV